jgi:hypothetical protein
MVNFMTQTSNHSSHKNIGILETNVASTHTYTFKIEVSSRQGYDTMSVDK